ncbi:MAG TPA: rRNA maturation RNase YbeY [Holosporales bacterium]|nr:rRNA maturation RNase YbeY [Holosporales bacterium]
MQNTSNIIVQTDDSLWNSWHSEEEWSQFFMPILQSIFSTLNIHESMEVSVLLTNDASVQELNKNFRGKDKATNVLSFPQLSHNDIANINVLTQPILLGDIVMSFDTIQKESVDQNKLFMNHLTHLFIHSLLHLLGYDHIDDDEANAMEKLEIHILSNLHISNPYH